MSGGSGSSWSSGSGRGQIPSGGRGQISSGGRVSGGVATARTGKANLTSTGVQGNLTCQYVC